MDAQTTADRLLDDDGNELLFPIASDVKGHALEADRGLRRYLIAMRDAIEKDDAHFDEETFADVFAFYETGLIVLDTANGDTHHFDSPAHIAMSAFAATSVGAAFFLLNSFSEQRGRKHVEFRRGLKMYMEFEEDIHNTAHGETSEERRAKALETLAEKMHGSGVQFVNLPLRDRAFPHAEFKQIAKNQGIGEPILMASINRVRNFMTSQDQRIEMGQVATSMLWFRVSQLGRAIKETARLDRVSSFLRSPWREKTQTLKNAHFELGQYVEKSGNAAAVPIALTLDVLDRTGYFFDYLKNAVPDQQKKISVTMDRAEDQASATAKRGLKILGQYLDNAIRFRRIPGIITGGVAESLGLRKDQREKAVLEKTPDIMSLDLFRYAAAEQHLPDDLEEQLSEMTEAELLELKEKTIEILRDIDGHTEGAKLARTSFIVQATFAGAQIGVGSLKTAGMIQKQEWDPTILFNVWSFFASIGPLRGFRDELIRERGLIGSKEANIAERLKGKLQTMGEDISISPDYPEETAPAA